MKDLLFLSHRIPYPPDKGDKIRSWNMFRTLAEHYRVHLGCLVDDPADWQHLPVLRQMSADVACFAIDKRRQKIVAALRWRPGRPLTLDYFHDSRLRRWTDAKMAAGIDRVFVHCSAMVPYVDQHARPGRRMLLDMVDVDSEKWTEYAARTSGLARLVWAREGRTLLQAERQAARLFDRTLFVSDPECRRFAERVPDAAGRIGYLENGVDLDFFSPAHSFETPFGAGGPHLVFTGTMDYWPNVDAVSWFAQDILPRIRERHPDARFHIVGASPTEAVKALASLPGVQVTGRVPNVRPYVAHADCVVTPLRIARGIQNKVLEAMAMARPVVASPQAYEGVRAEAGRDLLVADGPGFADTVCAVLDGAHPALGAAARALVERNYSWSATLAGLPILMDPSEAAARPATHPHTEPVA